MLPRACPAPDAPSGAPGVPAAVQAADGYAGVEPRELERDRGVDVLVRVGDDGGPVGERLAPGPSAYARLPGTTCS